MIDKYNYNDEPSGRVDTLAMALDKCERLEKQISVAVGALNLYTTYEEKIIGEDADIVHIERHYFYDGGEMAKQALNEIKELENERK